MSLLDRLRPDRPSTEAPGRAASSRAAVDAVRGRLASRLDLARDHAIRSHEPEGWLGGVLIGAWSALLSLLAVSLPVLLVWATSRTPTTWGQAVRVSSQAWLVVHGVAMQVPGGELHLLPLGLTALPAWLCWRAGRRLAGSAPAPDRDGMVGLLRSVGAPVAGLAGGYAAVTVVAALLAQGSGVRPVWWHAVIAGVLLPLAVGGASAVRTSAEPAAVAGRRRLGTLLADWCGLPTSVRRAAGPATVGAVSLLAVGAALVVVAVVVEHQRVLSVQTALDPGGLGTVVLSLAQLAILPNLALWGVAWFAGPGFAVGAGTAVTPAASTLGLLPLVPVLGALPSPGPLPAIAQAAVLLPVLVGAVVGWRCVRSSGDPDVEPGRSPVLRAVGDAALAAALVAVVLTLLVLLSAGSAGPGHLADVGPSAWRVGLTLLGELVAGASVTAWILGRRL